MALFTWVPGTVFYTGSTLTTAIFCGVLQQEMGSNRLQPSSTAPFTWVHGTISSMHLNFPTPEMGRYHNNPRNTRKPEMGVPTLQAEGRAGVSIVSFSSSYTTSLLTNVVDYGVEQFTPTYPKEYNMTVLTTQEQQQIDRANAEGKQPVVFVHGLWLLSSSWDNWRALFEEHGYTTLDPGWPDDPHTREEAKQDPEVFAHKRIKQVTDHYVDAIRQLNTKPAVIGHSFGGLIAQKIAGEGVAAVTVAIDPAPFRGVLPLPLSALKSSSAVLGNPLNYTRAVPLTYDQFRYAFANSVDESQAHTLYEPYSLPGSRVPIFPP